MTDKLIILLGFVILMGIGTATNILKARLDKAAQERRAMMQALAILEAHVTWQSGFLEMTDGQRKTLREAVDSQVSFRDLGP
jgi:hypothetical protein